LISQKALQLISCASNSTTIFSTNLQRNG
jgi:hypothetical protein